MSKQSLATYACDGWVLTFRVMSTIGFESRIAVRITPEAGVIGGEGKPFIIEREQLHRMLVEIGMVEETVTVPIDMYRAILHEYRAMLHECSIRELDALRASKADEESEASEASET